MGNCLDTTLGYILKKTRGVKFFRLRLTDLEDESEDLITLAILNDKMIGYKFNDKYKIVKKEQVDGMGNNPSILKS